MIRQDAIAIHHGGAFWRRWEARAQELGFKAVLVDGLGATLWEDLRGCDFLLWHLNQDNPVDLAHARSILAAVEYRGLKVFPNQATRWHFDDKIAQVKLLEAIGAPVARTWVFFSREQALGFVRNAEYPFVFKLRCGAGSMNVRLVPDRSAAERLVRRMFGGGLAARPAAAVVARTYARAKKAPLGWATLRDRGGRVFPGLLRLFLRPLKESGYVIFQEFIPGNDHDIRVTVIGERAFCFRRGVRPHDFRASGSGRIVHLTADELPLDVVREAMAVSRRLGCQSMAYDFVRRPGSGQPVLLEMSCVFLAEAVHDCLGYLESGERWHPGHFWPQDLILEDLVDRRAD